MRILCGKFQRHYLKFAIIHFVMTPRTYSRHGLCRIHHSRRRRGRLVPYDDDGNQTLVTTKTGTWRVTYNGENRPVRWVRESDNTTIAMSYDHMGRRREKNDQRFFYDGYLQIANFHSPTQTQSSNYYIWDCTEPIATRPLVWNRDSYASYYTHDGNKNVSEVIASESEIFAHYEYAPFGANPLQYGISAADNPWRFSSDYADCDVALIYYNFRNYEPFSGGWVSRDPVDEVGGRRWFLRNSIELETEQLNLYQMVRSNPIENIDILGESGCRCGPEIGDILVKTLRRVENDFNNLRKRSILRAWWICTGIHLAATWDINFDFISMPDGCAENECKDTFSVNGQCYNKWEINYILFGKISKLCDICRIQMEAMIAAHKIVVKPIIQTFSEEEYEWEYTHGVREWARIGRNMDGSLPQTLPNVDEKYSSCKSCDKKLEGWSNGFLTTWP